jgi:NAD(P)-dependent dehydrogenase (short-subunit alcohol dehydrogenase family)
MSEGKSVRSKFDLTGRVAFITGGAGLLGVQHANAVAEMGGIPVLVDISADRADAAAREIAKSHNVACIGISADITDESSLVHALGEVLSRFDRVDILINNAARDPKVAGTESTESHMPQLERFPIEVWNKDLAVGLTGAFLCSKVVGSEMARRKAGVILNIASDLGVIAPDQRIYREPGKSDQEQPAKAVSYSVVKHGLIGLTRYLATYWADRGVRVNALSPGGVYNGQEEGFVKRLSQLIPMGRMADLDEYKAAVVFLVSDASSYMTGANLIIDGGRTVW